MRNHLVLEPPNLEQMEGELGDNHLDQETAEAKADRLVQKLKEPHIKFHPREQQHAGTPAGLEKGVKILTTCFCITE